LGLATLDGQVQFDAQRVTLGNAAAGDHILYRRRKFWPRVVCLCHRRKGSHHIVQGITRQQRGYQGQLLLVFFSRYYKLIGTFDKDSIEPQNTNIEGYLTLLLQLSLTWVG
jgi:hypothetical protein